MLWIGKYAVVRRVVPDCDLDDFGQCRWSMVRDRKRGTGWRSLRFFAAIQAPVMLFAGTVFKVYADSKGAT